MAFDPRAPYWLSLDEFKSVPEEERPAFQFRRLNGREFIELSSVFEYNPTGAADYQSNVFRAFAVGLLGWKNQADAATGESVPFDELSLDRVINAQEALELIDKRLARGRLNAVDKKN